jgi:hypothetical protein
MSSSPRPSPNADPPARSTADTSMQVLQIVVAVLAVIAAIGLDVVR